MITYPPDFYKLNEWQRRVAQAVVPLTAHVDWPAIDKANDFMTSGFVVEAGGHWFWVTAEHAVDDLEALCDRFSRTTLILRPSGDQHAMGVIIAFPSRNRAFLSRRHMNAIIEEGGLSPEEVSGLEEIAKMDVAFIHLDALYVDSLRKTGVVPFGAKDIWQNLDAAATQALIEEGGVAFFIAGVPASSIQFTDDGRLMSWSVKQLNIIYDSIAMPNIVFRPMYSEEQHSGTVKGMSGGPAIAVKVATNEVFWIGVQSSQRITSAGSVTKLTISPAEFAYDLMLDMTSADETEQED